MKNILITGGTGFVGSNLIDRLLEDENNRLNVIVEDGYGKYFNTVVESYRDQYPDIKERLRQYAGELRAPDMGWWSGNAIRELEDLEEIYHLAAIYDLRVKPKIAKQVNVGGTRHVLDMAEKFPNLKSLNYVSTCYVSGKRKGEILEDELDEGQKFNNHYERTKFEAEVLVRERMDALPIKIFRPGIIVGDSKTGKTVSFNGLYYAFDALARKVLFARPGRGKSKVNFVPVDYVVDSMIEISKHDKNLWKTFQLSDPNPLSVKEVVDLCCMELNVKGPIMTLPYKLVEIAFNYLGMGKLLKIQKELIPYFNAQTTYDTVNVNKALEGTGIRCPHMYEYIKPLIRFWNEQGRPVK